MGGVCSFFFGCCGHQTHDPKGMTLVTERSCTDKILVLLYIAAWVLSIVVVSTAAGMGGNPAKIINGINFQGQMCGYSSDVSDKPLAALVNPFVGASDDPSVMLRVWTCVRDCGETTDTSNQNFAAMYGSTECTSQYRRTSSTAMHTRAHPLLVSSRRSSLHRGEHAPAEVHELR
jgi:hypothetical protein